MLSPYSVLDFTDHRGELGPMLLGDLGATVTRVEPPAGSSARLAEPLLDGAPADLASLQFIAFNRNKRSIVLHPEHDEDQAVLTQLLERTDFVFDSLGNAEAFGVTFERARAANPRVVFVQISAWGSTGPRADYLANELVIAAMGGPVSLQGVPERAPVRISVPQVWRHAGAEAAAGALAAHARMQRTGSAQQVDLSTQATLTWTMLQAMDAAAIQGFDFERMGATMSNARGAAIHLVHPCADGHLVALPLSKVIGGCLEWMIEDGVAPPSARDVDWPEFDLRIGEPDLQPYNIEQATAMLRAFFARHTKQELYEFGVSHNITLAPINSLPELIELQHLRERSYWHDLKLPNSTTVRTPGLWAQPAGTPLSVRCPAPALGANSAAVRAELRTPHTAPEYTTPQATDTLPFAGITVADFAWVGVGPISGKYLADHGATVVRVESVNRPDVLRGGAPFKDNEPDLNHSQFFGDFNTSKLGLTLDMKVPESLALARQLLARSDVFIESFAPGAVGRMGLGYEDVKQLNPGIIMVSTCLMGQTGSAARLAGYGYHAAAIAGFYEVTGWPDLPPSGPWTAYTDTIAPRFVSCILAAALDRKRRTGEGCFIDLAQIEAALHFLAPELLDFQCGTAPVTRLGNRDRYAAPYGCYPCAGDDQWCAIAVDNDDQWANLCAAMVDSGLNARQDVAQRQAAHDAIDAAISNWTRERTASQVMQELQAAGVPAGVVQRSSDLLVDPQYAHREFYRYLEHQAMGTIPYAGHQYRISNYDNGPRFAAPALGQHSFEVLSELLGLSDEEIGAAFACGAIN